MLCDTGGDVQKSPIWGLGNIGGNVDEVEISTVSTTQCPAHSDIHSSTDTLREVNTREGGDRGRTCMKIEPQCLVYTAQFILYPYICTFTQTSVALCAHFLLYST